MNPVDLEHCREAIRTGSRSFWAASKLLPSDIRDPALALYAFCRLADDAVDEVEDKAPAVLRLRDRLERAYAGRPFDAPAVVDSAKQKLAVLDQEESDQNNEDQNREIEINLQGEEDDNKSIEDDEDKQ